MPFKSLFTLVGMAVIGVVGYKVIKKNKPEWLDSAKNSIAKTTESVTDVLEGAKESFRDGYASA